MKAYILVYVYTYNFFQRDLAGIGHERIYDVKGGAVNWKYLHVSIRLLRCWFGFSDVAEAVDALSVYDVVGVRAKSLIIHTMF